MARWAAWSVIAAIAAAGCASRPDVADGAAPAREPVTWDAFHRMRDSGAAEARARNAERFFAGAEIVAAEGGAPARAQLEFVADRLAATGATPLDETDAARLDVPQCRVVILTPSDVTELLITTLAEAYDVRVRRTYGRDAWFVDWDRHSYTSVYYDAYEIACAAPAAEEPLPPSAKRPTWLVERRDSDGHVVMLTGAPANTDRRRAVGRVLERARHRMPYVDPSHRYFPDIVDGDSRPRRDDGGPEARASLYLPEERIRRIDGAVGWYDVAFEALEQPSLYERRDQLDLTVFRMTRLPSFSGPSSVTATYAPDGSATLTFRRISGDDLSCGEGGRARDRIRTFDDAVQVCGDLTVTERTLKPVDAARLRVFLDDQYFWSTPTVLDEGGLDGCNLIQEALVQGAYHVVDRWTCQDSAYPSRRQYFCDPDAPADDPHGVWPPACAAD